MRRSSAEGATPTTASTWRAARELGGHRRQHCIRACDSAACASSTRRGRVAAARPRVLFLCTGNSARSQMAEALLEQLGGGAVEAVSAGSHPKVLHPNAVRVMRERGIDISGRRTKHLDRFTQQQFDNVVTLCDRVREVCPEFPGHPALAHWSIPDPALEGDTDARLTPRSSGPPTRSRPASGSCSTLIDAHATNRGGELTMPDDTRQRPLHGR